MAHGSRICPACGKLNGASEDRCFYCQRRLPGPLSSALIDAYKSVLGEDFPMTKLLVGLNLLVFGLCVAVDRNVPLFSGGFRVSTLVRFGALARDLYFGQPGLEVWRYLSAMFVHASLLHVGFNLLALTNLGRALEPLLKPARFTVLFLASGVFGFLVSGYWSLLFAPPFGPAPLFTVGASGGVFGLLGALIGVLYARRDPAWKQALLQNALFAAILALAFPVNTPAHVGGAIVGTAFGYLLEKERRPARLAGLFRVLALLGLLASVGSIVLSQSSPLWREVERELYRR
jgi:rhomboid protease GluP